MKFRELHTRESSRLLDEKTISYGVPGSALMESAGAGAAARILSLYPNLESTYIFVGKGNNGGDGWVVARYLASEGIQVHILCAYPPGGGVTNRIAVTPSPSYSKNTSIFLSNLAEDAAIHARALLKMVDSSEFNITIEHLHEGVLPESKADTLLVDAILGTGLSSDVHSDAARAITTMNASAYPVISLDVPSGLDATTGAIHGMAVIATHTICFGVLKTGLYVNEGPLKAGDVHLVPLGFPTGTSSGKPNRFLLEVNRMDSRVLKKRRHKYDSGVVYVAGGSPGMVGAAIMAGKSAWNTGCGAVFLLVPGRFTELAEQLAPELIILARDDSQASYLDADDARMLLQKHADRPGTVLIGPGLGRNVSTKAFTLEFFNHHQHTAVIDADAIPYLNDSNVVAAHILTPHPGELQKLLGKNVSDDWIRITQSEWFAQHSGHTIVSKGYPTVVCSPENQTWITAYDTTIFNRAGFGDILAGAIAGWHSQSNSKTYSCLKSLTNGKLAHDKARQEGVEHPEPLNLI